MTKTKYTGKIDAITRITSTTFSLFRNLLLFTLITLLATALNSSFASASDINNIRYINAITGNQLVLNRDTNVTNVLDIKSGNIGIGQGVIL